MVLKEGMALNLEPCAGKHGVGGTRLANDHIVTKDGVDVYTTYPFDERLVDCAERIRQDGRKECGGTSGGQEKCVWGWSRGC